MLKRVLFYRFEKGMVNSIGPGLRRWGQSLLRTGQNYWGDNERRDELVPSLRCIPLSNKVFPKLLTADWVAPNATIIGDVELENGSSVWHTAIVRGDTAKIRVGKNSLIQDRAILKSTIKNGEINIGDNVYVGPNTMIDSWTLDDFAYVGMGATVHKGATIEPFAVVAAGAVVPENTTVPSGQVWAGNPAHYLRDVTQEEKHQISEYMIEMQQLSQIYSEETNKTFREKFDDVEDKMLYNSIDQLEKSARVLKDMGLPFEDDDMEYMENRVISQYNSDAMDPKYYSPITSPDSDERTWDPYEQDLSRYPEIFKMYGENYDRYEKVKKRFETEETGKPFGEPAVTPKKPKDQSPWEKKYFDHMPGYKEDNFQ